MDEEQKRFQGDIGALDYAVIVVLLIGVVIVALVIFLGQPSQQDIFTKIGTGL
jgi:hypothetical protein